MFFGKRVKGFRVVEITTRTQIYTVNKRLN